MRSGSRYQDGRAVDLSDSDNRGMNRVEILTYDGVFNV